MSFVVEVIVKNKFLAYEGEVFDIEWYFDLRGRSSCLDYYKDLPVNQREKLLYLFYILADIGKIKNQEKFRYEGDQIYAFKLAPDRFLCFFCKGAKVIITNAYEKKTDKMPPREKQKALNAKEDYIKRCTKDSYYE